ncbi:MAG: butyrate kinase, partial [Odoribacter sp.]|nr:butyrate kinase [Odoribacter sp.]
VSIFHALNQKSIARVHAQATGRKYEELNLVIAHLGGGVSVSAHKQGRVIDTNNALDGDGPFSPERSGGLPAGALVKLCFSGTKTQQEIKKMLCGAGGFVGYLNTNNTIEIIEKAASDPQWDLLLEGMCYQIAKEIGAMACVLEGQVDAILLTGGIAHAPRVTDAIAKRVQFIAPVKVYPGEDEMRALALNGLMVLNGELTPKVYS